MKNYSVDLPCGKTFIIKGEVMTLNETTGQTFIYNSNSITHEALVAIIPASASVRVV